MKIGNENRNVMVQYGIAAVVGVLAGIGTASWCVGLAAFIAMLVIIFKQS